MFPLRVRSRQLGYLPMKDEAWIMTPNPWWQFLTDRPPVPMSPVISSRSSVTGLDMQNSEKSLSEAEVGLTEPKVIIRKKLLTSPVECSLMGNLHMVKMIQFAEPVMNGTVLIKVTVRDRAPGPFYEDVGPNPREWVESCCCLSKWRFN